VRGTRYGDFSRFRRDRAGDGVLMQQGRVQLDTDWNAQQAAVADALRIAVADLFGGSCAPSAAPGFGLRPRMALEFNGSERLVLEEGSVRRSAGAGGHTLELWLSWAGGRCMLIDCRDAGADAAYTVEIAADGTPILNLYDPRPDGFSEASSIPATESLAVSTPVHLAVVIGPELAALYLDGRQITPGQRGGVADLDATFVVLGGPAEPSEEPGFVGLISGARAWQDVRTPAQLAGAEAPSPAGGLDAEPGLIAAWPFDEGAGTVLTDALGGRTAVLQGQAQHRWRLMDLIIEAGRFYVDGVMCELERPRRYSHQPGAGAIALPGPGRYIAYLEAWEESISAVQDPSLREVALGGLDTGVLTRVATRVGLVRADELIEADPETALRRAIAASGLTTTGRLAAEHSGGYAPGNYLYRVEVHQSGRLEGGSEHPAGQQGPTFKWSRDNGASLFELEQQVGGSDVVTVLPPMDGIELLAPGEIVEPLAAGAALDGAAPQLLRVRAVSEAGGRVQLSGRPAPGSQYLRRWDHDPAQGSGRAASATSQAATATGPAALPLRTGWTELEDGIRVRFEEGSYRRGDYWWIVARLDLRSIEWPQAHGHPRALAPDGVERVTAPLALLSLTEGTVEIEDIRRIVSGVVAERPTRWPPPPPPPDRGSERELVETEVFEEVEEVVTIFEDGAEVEILVEREVVEELELGEDELVVEEEEEELEVVELAPQDEPSEEPEDGAGGDGVVELVVEERELFGERELIAEREAIEGLELVAEQDVVEELEVVEGEDEPVEEGGAVEGWVEIGSLDLGGVEVQDAVCVGRELLLATTGQLLIVRFEAAEVTELARLPQRRYGLRLCSLGDLLVLIGGGSAPSDPDGRVLGFELSTGNWTDRARLPVRLLHPAVAASRGRAHVLGGRTTTMLHRARGEHHVYHPVDDRWSEAPALPTHRGGATALGIGGRLHVVGGVGSGRAPQVRSEHEVFDPATNEWESGPPLPGDGAAVGSGQHRGRHMVVREPRDGASPHTAVAFSAATGGWEAVADLPARLARSVVAGDGQRVYVIGAVQDGRVAVFRLG
jgi:Family of unknown function (DUF6519)/Kelch motif